MYNTKDFEQAMHVCSYKLDRVFYHKKHSRFVQKYMAGFQYLKSDYFRRAKNHYLLETISLE